MSFDLLQAGACPSGRRGGLKKDALAALVEEQGRANLSPGDRSKAAGARCVSLVDTCLRGFSAEDPKNTSQDQPHTQILHFWHAAGKTIRVNGNQRVAPTAMDFAMRDLNKHKDALVKFSGRKWALLEAVSW